MKNLKIKTRSRRMVATVLLAALAAVVPSGVLAANKLIVQDNSTTPVDKFVVTDTGFVGVGTNAPLTAVQTKGSTTATVQIMSHYSGAENLNGGGFVAYHNGPIAVNSGMPVTGDKIGYMLFGSYGTTGVARNSAGLVAYAETNWTDTNYPAYFLFETAPPNSTCRLERMRITSTGNIGIGGVPAPSQKLEVNGGVRLNTGTAQPVCDATVRGTLWFTKSAAGVADKLEVCAQEATATPTYNWKPLF